MCVAVMAKTAASEGSSSLDYEKADDLLMQLDLLLCCAFHICK